MHRAVSDGVDDSIQIAEVIAERGYPAVVSECALSPGHHSVIAGQPVHQAHPIPVILSNSVDNDNDRTACAKDLEGGAPAAGRTHLRRVEKVAEARFLGLEGCEMMPAPGGD